MIWAFIAIILLIAAFAGLYIRNARKLEAEEQRQRLLMEVLKRLGRNE